MFRVGTTLIVGASPDLVELAKLLGRDGERIALMSRSETRLKQFKERLITRNVDCEIFVADVTEAGSVLRAFQRFSEWSPRLDRLIYNVGMVSHESAASVTTPGLSKVMGANFFGFVNCLQLAMPMFKRTGGGHAIAISSAHALEDDQPVAYAASKASLRIYITALRREVNDAILRISEMYLGQMCAGKEWRDLTCEEIVSGLQAVIATQPERHLTGEVSTVK